MNDRLQQFLDIEKLSQSQFADTLGIQRPRLSHIFSGRNRPGYDFIEKFMQNYPNVNMEWLILGKGKMFKEQIEDSLPERSDRRNASNSTYPTDNKNDNVVFEPSQLHENAIFPSGTPDGAVKSSPERAKTISRITVFYADGSFEEFYK